LTLDARYGGTDPGHFRGYEPYLSGCGLVLDYGCGAGNFLAWAAGRGIPAEGYEPVPEVAAEARRRGFTVHSTEPDLARYDALVMVCVIEHLPPAELRRILENFRGTVVVQADEPRHREPWYLFRRRSDFWDDPEHVRPYTPEALRRLLGRCGYEVVARGRVKPPRPRPWQLRSLAVRFRLFWRDKLFGVWCPHFAVGVKK